VSASSALTTQKKEAKYRDIIIEPYGLIAVWTIGGGGNDGLTFWNPKYADIQKTADNRTQDERGKVFKDK
jgi:hypothetical protein